MTVEIPLSWLILPVLALLIYLPALNGPPIFDDSDVLGNLKTQFSWSRTWFRNAFRWASWRSRPLAVLSLAVEFQTPRAHHIGNALIHAACGMVVERLASQLGADPYLSLLVAVIYVAHPFAVNSVGYISGRGAVLATFFGLLAVLAVLTAHPLYMGLLLAASILAKEDGVGFAPLLLGVSTYSRQLIPSALLGIFVLAGILYWVKKWGFGRVKFQRKSGDLAMAKVGLPVSYPQPQHAITVFTETILRLPAWALGAKTSPYHGSGVPIPSKMRVFGAILILAALILICPMAPVPMLLILAGPWLVYLAVPVPDQIWEYRNYSMTAGFALLVVPLASLLPRFNEMAVLWVIFSAALTAIYAFSWSSPVEMWAAAILRASGDLSRAFQELGAQYKLERSFWMAEQNFREAIRLNPDLGPAMNNLAWTLIETDRKDEGVEWLKTCVARCPQYALGWEELGIVRDFSGFPDEAEPLYARAMELDPRMERSMNRKGLMHFYRNELEAADALFERAIRLRPDHPDYLYNHAVTLKQMGKMDAAVEVLKRVPQPILLTPNMIRLEYTK